MNQLTTKLLYSTAKSTDDRTW